MNRKQFTFYESFYWAIRRIKSKSARCDAYEALFEYALCGKEPNLEKLPDSVAIAFELIRPTLDASRRKAKSGSKGGLSKQSGSKTEANASNCKQTASEKEREKENEKEVEIEKENECIKADFALFWEAYPRKEGMLKAEEAFAKVVVPVQDLLDAIEAQKKSPQWKKENGLFIPHPAKWLEEKRWLDQMIIGTPKGADGELGDAELAAIAKMMGTNPRKECEADLDENCQEEQISESL